MSDVERESLAAARVSLIEAGRAASRWLKENVRWKQLGRTAVALMPLVVDYCHTRNSVTPLSNLILVSLCIGAARVGYGLPGMLLHALVILAAFGALLFAQHTPLLFAVLTTLFATSAVLLGRFRESWRTFGSFSLIPSVYLAMEFFEENRGLHLWSIFCQVARCSAVGLVFLSFLSWMWWKADRRTDNFFTSFGTPDPPNPRWQVMTLSVFIAEILVTTLIVVTHLPNAQWMVWSVVSVVTGDSSSARRKLKTRIFAAFIGVALGLLAGLVVPQAAEGVSLLTVAIALSLVAFRPYPIEFGSRCFFVALAGSMGGTFHYSELVGLERVTNVLIGGTLGLGTLLVVETLHNVCSDEWTVRWKSSRALQKEE
jgi:Fusaric acid resistance protein-like